MASGVDNGLRVLSVGFNGKVSVFKIVVGHFPGGAFLRDLDPSYTKPVSGN